jgi:hypothetical protein
MYACRVVLVVVLLMSMVGCGTSARVVRLRVDEQESIVYAPRGSAAAVELGEAEFKRTLTRLSRDISPSPNPRRDARQKMQGSVYRTAAEPRSRLLVLPASWVPQAREMARDLVLAACRPDESSEELTRDYGRWCELTDRYGDCLSLLQERCSLDEDGRSTLALSIAMGSVWEETKQSLADMADPQAVQAVIISSMAMYMMLWTLPEPTSKGLAATLTAALSAYLGVDTTLSLIWGWRDLVEAAERATTFGELLAADKRYGKIMGQNAARIFVMLITAALGETAALVTKGPGLPGYAQAAVLAEAQGGFRLSALAQVQEVALSVEGSFTLTLAPGALAMAAQSQEGSPMPSTLSPGPYASESIPAQGPGRNFTAAEREAINRIGRKFGCHTCGTKDPGTKSGDFIPDHQPASQLAPGRPQRLYPHCKACSLRQGGEVKAKLQSGGR